MLIRLRKNTLLRKKHWNFPPSNRYNHLVSIYKKNIRGDIAKLLETLENFNIQSPIRNIRIVFLMT